MSKVEVGGDPIIVPWRGDEILDVWEVAWKNTPERISRLTKLHGNLFPSHKEEIEEGKFENVHENIKTMCNYDVYKSSPVYWFLQSLDATVFVHCIFTSCLIQKEMNVQGKKFSKSVKNIVDSLLKKAVEYAKWDSSSSEKSEGFGIDDMFPLLNIETRIGTKEIERTRSEKRREERIPERFIPVFNLPFIYCQLYSETSLETMKVTIDNLGKFYNERKEETLYGSSVSWIEPVRLMKIQMENNLARVANLFKPAMHYIVDMNRLIYMERKIKNLKQKVSYWKKLGTGKKRKGGSEPEDEDIRIPKICLKLELPDFHSSEDEISE
jgi:hypothetical protein